MSALDAILDRGVIRIAVTWSPPPETGFPPEFWLDVDTGEPKGIAVEIGKLLAADLKVQPEFVDVPWGEQFAALEDGRVDLLPKPTMTPDRALRMEFSDRLMAFEVVVIARRDGMPSLADLDGPTVTISGWQGSSCNEIAQRRFPNANIVEYVDENEAKDAVVDGRADAIVTDAVTKVSMDRRPELDFVRDQDGTKVILAREYGHFAVKIGDQRFLNYLDSWIDYQRAMGVLDYWCDEWWLSWMAH
jgi:polar amino acid transport system substrate-binding protein